jgi:phosphoglycolate phosphatase-like HAD superfamily hydrolase
MTPPPQAIVFDLHGALIDTRRLDLECYRRALAPYLYREPGDDEISARLGFSERQFIAEWIGERYADDCLASVRRWYAQLHGALSAGPYDGVREMLDALDAAAYPLAIITGRGRETWDAAAHALPSVASTLVTADDSGAPDASEEATLTDAAGRLGVTPGACAYVTACAAGLRAARDAGMRVAVARWPGGARDDEERFVNEGETFALDWAFDRPADVTRAFAAWC